MDLGLSDATAVVSGGSKGMGRAVAECLAREGARVAVLARTEAVLDETVTALRALGSPDAFGKPTDLGPRTAVEHAFTLLSDRGG
jgi:NAD(P)-dependent dehydrogenase (short-subunit alcohol dehydrogenase family)